MAPKRRRRRAKKVQEDPIEVNKDSARIKVFQEMLNALDIEAGKYVEQIDNEYDTARRNIEKVYADKLSEVPEKYRNMTIAEFIQEQESLTRAQEEAVIKDDIVCEATSIMKKKERLFSASKTKTKISITGKKLNTNHRRSMSCPNGKPRKVFGQLQSCVTPLPAFCRASRVMSESDLNTPLSSQRKFNVRTPMPSAFVRKPRVGEVVSCQKTYMSASGSPVQDIVDNESDAPTVIIKLGKGKFISIAEDSDTNNCIKDLDEETKLKVKKMLKDIL